MAETLDNDRFPRSAKYHPSWMIENAYGGNPLWLATLAAAYAEVGRFDDAVRANQQALELAEGRGLEPLARRLRDRSATLRSRQPVRE